MKDNHDELMELFDTLQAKFAVLKPEHEKMVIDELKEIVSKASDIVQKMDYEGELD